MSFSAISSSSAGAGMESFTAKQQARPVPTRAQTAGTGYIHPNPSLQHDYAAYRNAQLNGPPGRYNDDGHRPSFTQEGLPTHHHTLMSKSTTLPGADLNGRYWESEDSDLPYSPSNTPIPSRLQAVRQRSSGSSPVRKQAPRNSASKPTFGQQIGGFFSDITHLHEVPGDTTAQKIGFVCTRDGRKQALGKVALGLVSASFVVALIVFIVQQQNKAAAPVFGIAGGASSLPFNTKRVPIMELLR